MYRYTYRSVVVVVVVVMGSTILYPFLCFLEVSNLSLCRRMPYIHPCRLVEHHVCGGVRTPIIVVVVVAFVIIIIQLLFPLLCYFFFTNA